MGIKHHDKDKKIPLPAWCPIALTGNGVECYGRRDLNQATAAFLAVGKDLRRLLWPHYATDDHGRARACGGACAVGVGSPRQVKCAAGRTNVSDYVADRQRE